MSIYRFISILKNIEKLIKYQENILVAKLFEWVEKFKIIYKYYNKL